MPASALNTQPSERRTRVPSDKLKTIAAEEKSKRDKKAATEEKARARKEKQTKDKAKAAERDRRRNQENIPLDTRQYSEDNFRQPAPQDPTFNVRDVATGITGAPINLAARSSKFPPSRTSNAKAIANPTPRGTNNSKTPARVLTAERASELVRLRTQTPSFVSQVHQPAARQTSSHVEAPSIGSQLRRPAAQQTSSHVEAIFDDPVTDNEGYADPWDRLDFPESPSPFADDDYELRNDNEADDRNNEADDVDDNGSPGLLSGKKRPRSDSLDADSTAEYETARKVVASKGKPKAGDYAEDVQDLLASTITLFKVNLLKHDPYADRLLETTWAKSCWAEANRLNSLHISYNTELIKMITCRASHLRGDIKTKVKPLVGSMFGFEVPTNDTIRARNRKLVEELKEGYAFLYKTQAVDDQPKSGLYEHPIIQKSINALFFKNRLDIGVEFTDAFQPFPHVALALVFAAIECAIDEWATGTRVDVHFTTEAYKDVYEEHLRLLDEFEEYAKTHGSPDLLRKLLQRIHDHGRIYAGADPLQKEATRRMAPNAFAAAVAEFNLRNNSFNDE